LSMVQKTHSKKKKGAKRGPLIKQKRDTGERHTFTPFEEESPALLRKVETIS